MEPDPEPPTCFDLVFEAPFHKLIDISGSAIKQHSCSPSRPPTSRVASRHMLFLSQLCFLVCEVDILLGLFRGVDKTV